MLFPHLDPEPDLSGADLARISCEAIKANLMDRVEIKEGDRLEYVHDDDLMNEIAGNVWTKRDPLYKLIFAPMPAIVPDGTFYHGVLFDAPYEVRQAADQYWNEVIRLWIQRRTQVFRQAAPIARIVELDAPNQLIFIAKEDEIIKGILDFLEQI